MSFIFGMVVDFQAIPGRGFRKTLGDPPIHNNYMIVSSKKRGKKKRNLKTYIFVEIKYGPPTK